jgi:hypothetical protein
VTRFLRRIMPAPISGPPLPYVEDMSLATLDTHQTVKDLTAAGFTDLQAEALAQALRQSQDLDLFHLASKMDTADVSREMAEMKAELIKWVIGVGFAQVATLVAVLKLFPGVHP